MSPAQKVLAAFLDAPLVSRCYPTYRRHQVAAAIRAAADEVVPVQMPVGAGFRQHRSAIAERLENRRQLLAIAAELEGQP
jgi:hypothetical protein